MPVGLTSSTPVFPPSIGTGVQPERPGRSDGQPTATAEDSRRPVSSGSESARPRNSAPNQSARNESNASGQGEDQRSSSTSSEEERQGVGAERGVDGEPLTRGELREVRQLEARDREVRAHERAHQAVGGQYAGSPQYTYTQGPDGDRYATGGEVSIDAAPIKGDPQATLEKMRIVRAAALAPANPSAQDQRVAAEATQAMLQAQLQLARQESGVSRLESTGESGKESRSRQPAASSYEVVALNGDRADTEPFRASA
ncbi:SprA family protein [Tamilnaduibacter salinus]|uniref:SprA family protein n=1 Tax=Tamilnaduibacter salinus TaxID=1484056 RepID=A0A2U1CUG1_9GAMM|nr:putative metalloprotease CJM1_0395 family protein [Tamilnaduibacter salinus]PVY70722.1 SprA family protein [Tamilnaduibacter salinus]